MGFVALHLLMVLKLGINERPMPGRVMKRATYARGYHELAEKDGAPFVPYAVWKDLFFAAFVLLAVARRGVGCGHDRGGFCVAFRPSFAVLRGRGSWDARAVEVEGGDYGLLILGDY